MFLSSDHIDDLSFFFYKLWFAWSKLGTNKSLVYCRQEKLVVFLKLICNCSCSSHDSFPNKNEKSSNKENELSKLIVFLSVNGGVWVFTH